MRAVVATSICAHADESSNVFCDVKSKSKSDSKVLREVAVGGGFDVSGALSDGMFAIVVRL